jgi:ABC-type bacteriocin/lantibiotic exporter with double-glycine peptidase domain
MNRARSIAHRHWLAPEVVQTSTMDCGPAALACILEGLRLPVSYARLREACQTDIDGTSIDAIEVAANQLGVQAEQHMMPIEHLFLKDGQHLPAIVVVRHADGATHFVVVWRRFGQYLQVMDPALGRRWVSCRQFAQEVFQHEQSVSAQSWRQWAESEDFLSPLRQQLVALGTAKAQADVLIQRAMKDPLWLSLAALDASVRYAKSVVDVGGLGNGARAAKLAEALFDQIHQRTKDIFNVIPQKYWSATSNGLNEAGKLELQLQGAVLLTFNAGLANANRQAPDNPLAEPHIDLLADTLTPPPEVAAPSPELVAALGKQPPGPFATIWGFLKQDGLLSPIVLVGVALLAAAVVVIELLLFRGLFDVTTVLNLPSQRLGAVVGLMALIVIIMLIEIPMTAETMRMGRQLEVRLRMALLEKLPRLSDRYFQSRPVSDMADRSHGIHMTRTIPGQGLRLVQLVGDLTFTLLGILFIDPQAIGWAMFIVVIATALPLSVQPFLNERDLRVRNQAGALQGFYLDALLGLIPIRTHRAERAVRRQHESLLVEWTKSIRGLNGVSVCATAAQSLLCTGLAAYVMYEHFMRAGAATAGDLLLIFWTLKLPALGNTFAAMATQYPMQRNVLLRLLEPLAAPTENDNGAQTQRKSDSPRIVEERSDPKPTNLSAAKKLPAQALAIKAGTVIASGHLLLRGVDLKVTPGEHVAIVGSSGAGKSTLLGLILGWHRLTTGEFTLDGEIPTPSTQAQLRRNTAWVDPSVQIWNRSFLENLTYATDQERFGKIGEVLEAAELRSVLQKLPLGLQTLLGEAGALLSGGEGQRVRLARALMQSNVRLALLDEPFRGLDRSLRAKLLTQTRHWWREATLLCITHDVAETLTFNRVLVIEHGHIVEDGPPEILAASPTRYRELLDAENQVRERLWSGTQWRHIRAENGLLIGEAQQARIHTIGTVQSLHPPVAHPGAVVNP